MSGAPDADNRRKHCWIPASIALAPPTSVGLSYLGWRVSMLRRQPSSELRPFVTALWATSEIAGAHDTRARERVLPTSGMHLAVVLSGDPPRVFRDLDDATGSRVGGVVLGGARASSYVRDARGRSSTVGVQFQPGAASRLLGVDADEFAGAHTDLADVWGRVAEELRERLAESPSRELPLDVLEQFLRRRIERARSANPCVENALAGFARGRSVSDVARESGFSHRHFLHVFRRDVGLAPKEHARVHRFERMLAAAKTGRHATWAALALATGYCDQSHLNREFGELAGMTPGEYRSRARLGSHHVPIPRDANAG
jgi:AraC-like DNA-binding protein